MITVTSSSNPAVKEVKQLKTRKEREEKGIYFVEGVRIVEEAFEAGAQVVCVFISEQLENINSKLTDMLEKSACRKYTVTEAIFKDISDTETPQGILAVIKIEKNELSAANLRDGLFVVLDSVRDPGNMGTIIRTADAAGFSGVITCKGCVDVYNPKVLRSTMGSIFHIPIYSYGETVDAVRNLKAMGISVLASHLHGKKNIFQVEMLSNTALIIGSEADGVSDTAAAEADMLVRIPMPGSAESLNASVAAAIMMFESVRQRERIK